MATNPYIFVYGTLMKKFPQPKPHNMEDYGLFVGEAHLFGKLYEIANYPGIVLNEGTSEKVFGEVFKLYRPEETLALLDEYEMCSNAFPIPQEYTRIQNDVHLESGAMAAWVYIYTWKVDENKRINHGNYHQFLCGE